MTAAADPIRLRRLLLDHYDTHRRDLPWRKDQEPYRVWVSEIMLQQTRVETAIPYYDRWMELFPTVEALADVDEAAVLKAWEGLGYYSRARNLRRSALIVRERLGGVLPQDSRGLKTLPGIGEYTAGAIASIAHGEVVPAVDGNVKRVLSRLFDLEDPTAASLRERADTLVDPDRPGDWNQALMELGATVCTPRAPGCEACPLGGECRARAEGTQALRPAAGRRPHVRNVAYAVLILADSAGRLLMVRRPTDGLLGGLWEFPGVEVGAEDEVPMGGALRAGSPLFDRCQARLESLGVGPPPSVVRFDVLAEVRHAFTHLKAVYHPMLRVPFGEPMPSVAATPSAVAGPSGEPTPETHTWVLPDQVEGLPLPVAQRKILDLANSALTS